MSYFVFSRKYRPQKFGEVIAQKHISETLTKAIENDRISQAYLFCGVRGTGKTTVARILAKRLNCANPQGAEPCNECESCLSIVKGNSLDILEIDAASHTSVDDVRDLRESIKYAPVGGKHKVYIIDEVHRLSGSAFDALLKTLEEPPAHAVFIFATTEVHKVPQTILSRCQRYDFKRIPEAELRSALSDIARKENLKITDEALVELAKRGDGSLRDALSTLDQVASWQHEVIDIQLLTDALGILPRSEYLNLIRMTKAKESANIIKKIGEILESGIGAPEFIRGFQEEIRLMIVMKVAPAIASEYGIPADDVTAYNELNTNYSLNDLLRIQNLMVDLEQKIRDGFDPLINIELAMLKLIAMEDTATLETVLKMLSGGEIEAEIESTTAPVESKKKSEVITFVKPPETPEPNAPAHRSSSNGIDLHTVWPKFLQALKSTHRSLQLKLTLAEPRGIEENRIQVAFDRLSEFHVRQLQDREIQQTLEEVMKNVCGKHYRFNFFVDRNMSHKKDGNKDINLFAESEKEDHPLIVRAMEVFDAEVVGREDLDKK